MDKFRHKNGDLTRYAFACGYIQTEAGEHGTATLSQDSAVWSVRGEVDGVRYWNCFDRLADARKHYARLVSRINGRNRKPVEIFAHLEQKYIQI